VKIEVPDGDGWRKVEDKEIIEEHLMERNIEQFSPKKIHSAIQNWEPISDIPGTVKWPTAYWRERYIMSVYQMKQ
jgi:hypothetical protein